MRTYLIIVIFLIVCSTLSAQQKLLTLEEAILGSSKQLKIQNIEQLQWIPEQEAFSFYDTLNHTKGLYLGVVESSHRSLILSLDSLNKTLTKKGLEKLKSFPKVTWLNSASFHFQQNNQVFIYDQASNELTLKNKIDSDAVDIDLEPVTLRMAFRRGNNLFIALNPNQQIQISFDTENGVSNGSSDVHRNEFSISKGTFWSSAGNYLAYYHLDRRMVTEYPLVDVNERPAKLRLIRYPMAGLTSEQAQVAVYDLRTGSTTYLQTGQPADQYLTNITWSPDEKFIYVVHLNREQNHQRLIQYDPLTGLPVKTILEEKNEKWIEPEHGPIFIKQNPRQFLWFSKRDGFNHLYLYEISGKLLRQVTKGPMDVTVFKDFANENKMIFFEAATDAGMERHGFLAWLNSGKMCQLTDRSGIHRISPSSSGNYFYDVFSSSLTPRQIRILDQNSHIKQELLQAKNPLEEYNLGDIQFMKLPNREGLALNGRMILPLQFDESKKYPVIVYVYGGPHGQMVSDSWISGWPLWFQYLAQRGYIVFTLDNRGINNRGLDFEQAIFRRLGTVEVEDQMAGIDHLKSLSFVDTSRIGIHGWSYGGFLTISLMTRQPGVFKVGVAGGPVIDWRYYEVMYGERYMDTPQSNPDGYEESCLLNYVNNLQGKLLIIHGSVDPTVVGQHSLLYLRKAIDLGKQVDYFVYPGDEHNMNGNDRLHLYQKITDYFDLHLR